MSAHVLGRAQIAPLFAMCTIPGETPNSRIRARAERKIFLLLVGLLRGEIFRGSEMRERSFELNMLAIGQRAREGFDLVRRNSQPVHARIDLQMKRHASFAADRLGAAFQVTEDRPREIPPASGCS